MTKHKSHDERQAQILAAAKTCFIRAGYAHTRVDDIAKEAGLSKGGIYFHFKSKREIFDELHKRQQEATRSFVEDAGEVEGSAAAKLTQLASRIVSHFTSDDDHRKFLIVLAEMGIRDPALHEKVQSAHVNYVDAIETYVQAGIDEGAFRNVRSRQLALLLKFLIDGVEQGVALGYEFDPTELLAVGLDTIFNGIRHPDAAADE